jgi:hypothetical protein
MPSGLVQSQDALASMLSTPFLKSLSQIPIFKVTILVTILKLFILDSGIHVPFHLAITSAVFEIIHQILHKSESFVKGCQGIFTPERRFFLYSIIPIDSYSD